MSKVLVMMLEVSLQIKTSKSQVKIVKVEGKTDKMVNPAQPTCQNKMIASYISADILSLC